MKTLKIHSYLRPAIFTDIFDKDGLGSIMENKQVFYKTDGIIKGPYRLHEPDAFINEEYFKLNFLISEEYFFVVDSNITEKSILVKLKIIPATQENIMEPNKVKNLVNHTIFWIADGQNADGPFVITPKTNKQDVLKYIHKKQFFILDESPNNIEKVIIETTAEAV